jgi:hypothetical protein
MASRRRRQAWEPTVLIFGAGVDDEGWDAAVDELGRDIVKPLRVVVVHCRVEKVPEDTDVVKSIEQ